jgi:hypothetical protein
MVTFAPIERSLDVLAQEWRIDKIEQIEAADDIVVFPQRLACLVFSCVGVELVDNNTLRRRFECQRNENALQVLPLFHNHICIEFADGFQKDVAILSRMLKAIERRAKFLLDGFLARCELIPEEMQQRKIDLVGSMGVGGMHLWVNVRGIIEEQIEDKVALMIVGTDQLSVQRDMIGNQGIGHDPLCEAKVFRRIACIECRKSCFKLLPITTGVEHIGNIVVPKHGQSGNGITDAIIGCLQGFKAQKVVRGACQSGERDIRNVTHASQAHVGGPSNETGAQNTLIGSVFAVASQDMLKARHEVAVVIDKVEDTADAHLRYGLKDRMVD